MSGKRERNSALCRINLVKEFEKRLKEQRFDQIKVKELCDAVDISKVTFFKYFNTKEELLRYYYRIWCLQISSELNTNPRKGLKGLFFLLEKIVTGLNTVPNFFYAYYSYQVDDNRIRSPFPLKKIEREMILQNEDTEFDIRSVYQLIENFVLEAIFGNELQVHDSHGFSEILYKYIVGLIVLNGLQNSSPNYIEEKAKIDLLISKYK